MALCLTYHCLYTGPIMLSTQVPHKCPCAMKINNDAQHQQHRCQIKISTVGGAHTKPNYLNTKLQVIALL